jgi:hypothetical protein
MAQTHIIYMIITGMYQLILIITNYLIYWLDRL